MLTSTLFRDNNVKVLLTDNKRSPEREPEEEENATVEEESHQAEREDELPIPQTVPTKEKSPAPVISTPKVSPKFISMFFFVATVT